MDHQVLRVDPSHNLSDVAHFSCRFVLLLGVFPG